MIHVTDHAILRYLERVMGFDIEGVRKHIAKVCAAGELGASAVRAEGVKFTISNNAVTSVTPDSNQPSKTHQRRLAISSNRAPEGNQTAAAHGLRAPPRGAIESAVPVRKV